MRLVWVPLMGRLAVEGAPEGYCPWGEAKCDRKCEDWSGCKLERPRKTITG